MPDRYGDEPDPPADDGPIPLDSPADLAYARAQAVLACDLCDDEGYRGMTVCDHEDHSGAAARGMAKAREVLDEIKARRGGL